jgi:hypothetical protein
MMAKHPKKSKRSRSADSEQLDEQRLYGFELGTDKAATKNQNTVDLKQKSFALPQNEDGAVTVAGAGYYGTYVDLDGTFRNETQLITKYREMAIQPEMEGAIDQIVNDAIVHEDDGTSVEIVCDNLQVHPSIKKKIEEEFDHVLKLLNFGNMGHEVFRRWYIDGRLFYHVVIDDTNRDKGIIELKYVDPRRIRKIREIQKTRDPQTGIEIIKKAIEYYLYNERGLVGAGTNLGSKIAVDSIININSGIMDPKQTMVLSYLHKAIKPLNNLRMMEDATVIYRLSRAPERRIFYIDVGNMPTIKADQYVRDIMVKYRNKLVYNSDTGEIKDDRKHLSMLEDFWLPRREGSKGTEISTLEGARNLGELEDVKYFEKKLFKALNLPLSRLEPNQGFSLGRTTEITRDELNFNKFIIRLRNKFASLFDELLRTQLLLKRVCTEEEWKEMREDIYYDFKKDNNFDELKEADLLSIRLDILTKMDPFVGKYFSIQWVRKHLLQQTDEDMEEQNAQMQEENKIAAQAQAQQAQDQLALQGQALQQQTAIQTQGAIEQQAAQAEVQGQAAQQQVAVQADQEKIAAPGRDHEQAMMDKKIELEKVKSKHTETKGKFASKKPPAKKTDSKKKPEPKKKKKTVSEEAKELGLIYAGMGRYLNRLGEHTHQNENGILINILNEG